MNKKGKKNKNGFTIKISKKMIYIFLSAIALIVPVLIIILKTSNNTIITAENEYWVADMEVKIDNIEKEQYKYTTGAKLYGFSNNNKCEVLTMNLEYAEDGSNILANKTFYNENLNQFTPTGAWVSSRTNNCTYEITKDSIILNINEAGESYTLVGTYTLLKNDLMLISWTNNDLTNVSYSKVKLNEYIEDFYLYSGKIDPKFTCEIKEVTVNVNDINVYYSGNSKDKYVGLNDLINYLKNKYKIDIDLSEFGHLNKSKDFIYAPGQNYVLYDMEDDNIKLMIPLRILTEDELKEKIKKNRTDAGTIPDVKIKMYDYWGNFKYYNYYLLYHFDSLQEYKNAYYIDTTKDLD